MPSRAFEGRQQTVIRSWCEVQEVSIELLTFAASYAVVY
jgi:hypothetical protein